MSNQFSCPVCSSDQTQRFSVIYEQGLSDINTRSRTVGAGVGGSHLGLGALRTKTSGTSQTMMSKKASPPTKKRFLLPLLAIFIASGVISWGFPRHAVAQSVINIVWLLGSISWVFYAIKYNTTTYRSLKEKWANTFLCLRCNNEFKVD